MDVRSIANTIVDRLFEKDTQFLLDLKERLVKEHVKLGGSPDGFLHASRFFTTKLPAEVAKIHKQRAYPQLEGEADYYLLLEKKLFAEQQRLRQGLALVMAPCRTDQDVRDCLSDRLLHILPEYRSLSRTREEAWTLANRPIQKSQYEETRKLVDFYMANQMLY